MLITSVISRTSARIIFLRRDSYEIFDEKPPCLSHVQRDHLIRIWELISNEQRDTIDPRFLLCCLLGYSEPNQYKLYEDHSGRVIFSRDVEFDERTPVAPLIEGESSTLPVNDPPSLDLPKLPIQLCQGTLLTPPSSPRSHAENPDAGGIPDPANSSLTIVSSIPDMGFVLCGWRC